MKKKQNTMSPKEVNNIAHQLGVKPQEVMEMETRFSGRDISLDPVPEENDEDNFSPITYLTDGSDPLRELETAQTARLRDENLKKTLNDLDERSRRIIEARWLREKDTATLHDLAGELGVSAERVRQIEAKAIQKMRNAMTSAQ